MSFSLKLTLLFSSHFLRKRASANVTESKKRCINMQKTRDFDLRITIKREKKTLLKERVKRKEEREQIIIVVSECIKHCLVFIAKNRNKIISYMKHIA